jgi:hypothetical protein
MGRLSPDTLAAAAIGTSDDFSTLLLVRLTCPCGRRGPASRLAAIAAPLGGRAMKVHIDIDCTPEEARTFFGLPDVAPMQEVVMKELQDRMMAAMRSMDPETLMKTWMPAGIAGLEQMQKMFWQQFGGQQPPKK